MTEPRPDDEQGQVDRYFDEAAAYWDEVYRAQGIAGRVYRERQATAIDWIAGLGLPPAAPVLDAGCGAGLVALALAQLGCQVTAADASEEMVRLTAERAARTAVPGRVETRQADVHNLPFADGAFVLVVALGVLPWLHDAPRGVAEIARVLAPGGWAVLTADNALRMNMLVEPRESPVLLPVKPLYRLVKRARGGVGPSGAPSHRHSPGQVERMISAAGLRSERRTTVGYGPFTWLGRSLLSEPAAAAVQGRLQRASRDHPALRRHGWHYLVAAQKPS